MADSFRIFLDVSMAEREATMVGYISFNCLISWFSVVVHSGLIRCVNRYLLRSRHRLRFFQFYLVVTTHICNLSWKAISDLTRSRCIVKMNGLYSNTSLQIVHPFCECTVTSQIAPSLDQSTFPRKSSLSFLVDPLVEDLTSRTTLPDHVQPSVPDSVLASRCQCGATFQIEYLRRQHNTRGYIGNPDGKPLLSRTM
ncbi:hypothetical protein BJX64DRAFT_265945 [Aspergillus heterothallicus]